MKILLIGGAGYIGIPLTHHLIGLGYDVTILDSLVYQQDLNLPNGITLIKDDVRNIKKYIDQLDKFDVIFYMVSPRLLHLGNNEQIQPQLEYLEETVKLVKKQRFFFFSSCSVYGHSEELLNENSKTMVTSFYSELKIKSEELLKKYKKNITILRLSTLFGYSPVSRNDLLINNFIRDIEDLDHLEIYDGNAWRPNIHIDDLVQVLEKIVKENISEKVINVGHDSLNITKLKLVEIIQKFYKKKIKVVSVVADDSRNYKVDFGKINNYIKHSYNTYENSIMEMIK